MTVLVFSDVAPTVIAPLLLHQEELPLGTLRTELLRLFARAGVKIPRLLSVKGTGGTGRLHGNAILIGFGDNRRVMVMEELRQAISDDEFCAIVAHELGHATAGHMFVHIAWQLFSSSVFLAFFAVWSDPSWDVLSPFGFDSSKLPGPCLVAVSLTIFAYFFQVVAALMQIVMNSILRKTEFDADAYASAFPYPLRTALIKTEAVNWGNLAPDTLYGLYYFSHPSLIDRLAALEKLDKKRD